MAWVGHLVVEMRATYTSAYIKVLAEANRDRLEGGTLISGANAVTGVAAPTCWNQLDQPTYRALPAACTQ